MAMITNPFSSDFICLVELFTHCLAYFWFFCAGVKNEKQAGFISLPLQLSFNSSYNSFCHVL